MEQKTLILEAAVKLFAKNGLDGVSIREIADEAGVHFANIRHHYGDKGALYQACISEHGDGRLKAAKKYLSDSPANIQDARLRLAFALSEVFEIHAKNPYLTLLVLREVESNTDRSDKVLKNTMLLQTKIHKEFFENCIRSGLLEIPVDTTFLITSLMGVIHHYMRTEGIRSRLHSAPSFNDKNYRDEIVNKILILFFDCHIKKPNK